MKSIIEIVKQSAKTTGKIMIESHFTKKIAVHRKPIFKNKKVYVRYFKRYYEVIDHKELFPEYDFGYKLYRFKINF